MFMVNPNTLNVPHFYGHTSKCVVDGEGIDVPKIFSSLEGSSKF